MNKILLVAMVLCTLGLVGMAFGQDQDPGSDATVTESGGYVTPSNGDPWNASPQPSGMRFSAAGGGTGMPCCGDYNYCWTGDCSCARCAHWTQYSWYAPWCYSCGECYRADGRHEWLH
jgi:hypothetical protein